MTIKKLNQIKKLRRDIDAIKSRIEKEYSAATSCVSGGWRRKVIKSTEGNKERCTVLQSSGRMAGSVSDKVGKAATELTMLKKDLARLERKLAQLVNYINSIPDFYIREAMILHFVEEETWDNVARRIGRADSSGNCLRMTVERYLEKVGKSRGPRA